VLLEFGNHAAPVSVSIDPRPKTTIMHFPEADVTGLGGYSHKVGGISVADFKAHRMEALDFRGGITCLPDHEILLSAVAGWPSQATAPPVWVSAGAHELTPPGVAADVEMFLSEFYGCPTAAQFFGTSDPEELLVRKELQYWTRTPPGELPPGLSLPPASALYTNDGRVISNVNDGGGQVGATGQATGSSSTSLTNSGAAWTTNQWAGYRVYATVSATVMVWGNVVSNTATALTVDRWYASATPGGSAGSTPSTTATYMLADGGFVSTWFVGLASGSNSPVATDHTLATNGNVEITTAGGGLVRKIAPYAQTSGVSTRSITLTPVFTANGTDSLPVTVTTIGVFCSMVVGTTGTMKFETTITPASATLSASGDQLTITESIAGS
jgi:hypothetical protein